MTSTQRKAIEELINLLPPPQDLMAAQNLLLLMEQAETREEFLLYVEGLDSLKIFQTKFLQLLITGEDKDLLDKAIELRIIRRKTK